MESMAGATGSIPSMAIVNIFVFLFAIAISLYTEKRLIPMCRNSAMKFAVRWGYTNSILMALAQFHPALKWLHTAYIVVGALIFWKIIDDVRVLAELEDDRARRAAHDAEIARQQRMKARQRLQNAWVKSERDRITQGGCPAGYDCFAMGSVGDGCLNRETCDQIPKPVCPVFDS
jgi:type II secretory pathway component PulF